MNSGNRTSLLKCVIILKMEMNRNKRKTKPSHAASHEATEHCPELGDPRGRLGTTDLCKHPAKGPQTSYLSSPIWPNVLCKIFWLSENLFLQQEKSNASKGYVQEAFHAVINRTMKSQCFLLSGLSWTSGDPTALSEPVTNTLAAQQHGVLLVMTL